VQVREIIVAADQAALDAALEHHEVAPERIEALARSASTDYHRANGDTPEDPDDGGRVSDMGRGTARSP
jgi:hypothetical protein